ncbi:TetR/AcrR family transcriptional regulator [Allokutzneria sp. NRRL B-24872]|uniref:TetR/AcrR family transcriptional regulator n=1 Tax=Allokutzneria sp. NRRL B-24872 TaxID=1137961 RepID=UPI00143D4594|nr:TetR/AcrR family transcriptional regulator [Allokutzneria sp. NRRL B-24872]
MPRPKSDSRDKIVDSARKLLRRQGYHATGLAQVIEDSGAPRGSLYFLFPGGKEELAVAGVRECIGEWVELIGQARAVSATPEDWISLMCKGFAEQLRDSDFTEGCPITTVVLDSVPTSEPLTEACRDAYSAWLGALAEGLVSYGIAQERADELAMLMLVSLEGAMVLCRAFQSTEPMERVIPQVLALIEHRR